jgi:hypothetical protein
VQEFKSFVPSLLSPSCFSPIVGIHWCFDALEVASCPNVELKKRQERELSEFGDLQLSGWISCWTRIHVSNSIFICYSSFCQGEMTTSLGSQSDRRWWMRLITLFPCLWICLVKNFAIACVGQGEMTTSLGSQTKRRWWMRLITFCFHALEFFCQRILQYLCWVVLCNAEQHSIAMPTHFQGATWPKLLQQ